MADAIGVVWLVVERNQLQKRPTNPSRSQPILAAPRTNSNLAPGVLGTPPVQCGNANPISFQHLTNQEARERREKERIMLLL